jgi:predicted RNase H-like HicB family nuclease
MAAGHLEGQSRQVQASDEAGTRDGRASIARYPARDAAIDRKAIGFEVEVKMGHYIALIHKDPESDYGVSFPDLPGCVAVGATLDEARAMAVEVLALHLDGIMQDGNAVPAASSLEQVMADLENRDGVAVLVDAPKAPGKTIKVNITMPDDLVALIDTYAEARGLTRSGFLARAARHELKGR